jgi:hypothetical protein
VPLIRAAGTAASGLWLTTGKDRRQPGETGTRGGP